MTGPVARPVTRHLTQQQRTRRRIYVAFGAVMLAALASFLSVVMLSWAYPAPHVPYGVTDPAAKALRESSAR